VTGASKGSGDLSLRWQDEGAPQRAPDPETKLRERLTCTLAQALQLVWPHVKPITGDVRASGHVAAEIVRLDLWPAKYVGPCGHPALPRLFVLTCPAAPRVAMIRRALKNVRPVGGRVVALLPLSFLRTAAPFLTDHPPALYVLHRPFEGHSSAWFVWQEAARARPSPRALHFLR
jgi:hypothetical protein